MPRFRPSPVRAAALALYSAGLTLALALTSPWWARKLRRGGKYRDGVAERLGRIPARLQRPARETLWLHAVSVGEVLAAVPLIRILSRHASVYVSTTTGTGQSLARERFGAERVFYFPLDYRFAVRAWLRFLRPKLLVLVESEFWPRLLDECARGGIPVAVVNTRVSPRSWPRYRRLRRLWRPLLGAVSLAHAQSDEDASRLRVLGVPRVEVAGNLKYDLPPAPETPLLAALRRFLPKEAPVLVCGSTLPGEEALLLEALPREPVLLFAPRHPERFREVAAVLGRQPRPWLRLSRWRESPEAIPPGAVLLLDSVGELGPLYALATVAVVGGGLLHPGGHNPLEPAALGKPVVIGPGCANFREVVAVLRAEDALVIAAPENLRAAVAALLSAPDRAAELGARAQAVCARNRGATARAASALLALLERP